jgi:hypothetical protein
LGLVESVGSGLLTFAILAFVLELLWVWWRDWAVSVESEQHSGADRVTDISRMARAAGTFLFLLIGWEMDGNTQPNNPHKGGHGTINEALAASAEAFTDLPDRFELVHGDGSIKLFP